MDDLPFRFRLFKRGHARERIDAQPNERRRERKCEQHQKCAEPLRRDAVIEDAGGHAAFRKASAERQI
jgi:hypothetical protein